MVNEGSVRFVVGDRGAEEEGDEILGTFVHIQYDNVKQGFFLKMLLDVLGCIGFTMSLK